MMYVAPEPALVVALKPAEVVIEMGTSTTASPTEGGMFRMVIEEELLHSQSVRGSTCPPTERLMMSSALDPILEPAKVASPPAAMRVGVRRLMSGPPMSCTEPSFDTATCSRVVTIVTLLRTELPNGGDGSAASRRSAQVAERPNGEKETLPPNAWQDTPAMES